MAERPLTSWKRNKTKLVKESGYKSIVDAKRALGGSTNDATYKELLTMYNETVKERNEERKKDLAKRKSVYSKDKRESSGNYERSNYKLLPNNSKIESAGFGFRKGDLDRYSNEKGVFAMEVRVYYDSREKAEDWTEDNKKWKDPFRTSRAEVVIADSMKKLKKKAEYKATSLKIGLENVSPELNTKFVTKFSNPFNSNKRIPLNKIKMRLSSPLKLNGDPLPTFEMGQGRCVYDALIYLWSQPNSKMLKKANIEYLNSVFMNDENQNPQEEGISIDTLLDLAKRETFSIYAFDIHDRLITKYTSEATRQSKKPPLIFRIYNEHMYLICDKAIQASLIGKNRNGEHIRHVNVENDKAKFVKPDEKVYENVIPKEQEYITDKYGEKVKKSQNLIAYEYIMDNNAIPFPFTNKNINYDKGHITSMKIGDKHVFTAPVERDILDYLEKQGEDYKGQHYINILMEKWEEHYGYKLSENELISHMNPIVCDLMNEENVKNRVHFGATMELEDIEQKIDDGQIVGADIIKDYSSIIDNPMDNWLVYELTDEIDRYNGKLQTGLYFVVTDDLTILHKTNWYSNTIIQYALSEGIELQIIRQYIPTKQENNKDYFKKFIDYISEQCGMKLTKNILNSITGMLGKTKQSSYKMSITSDMNEVWAELEDNIDRIDDFKLNRVGEDDKMIYIYGFKSNKNIYTNNLPMYIQILDQSNIKLHKLAKQMGGEMLFRKTDAVMMYMGKNVIEFDKTKRENWGKQTIMEKDELKKYDYTRRASEYRAVVNKFDNCDDWWNYNQELYSSSQYKEIIEYAIEKGGLMICSRAGTGKSYVVQKGAEDGLLEEDKRCRLAFTNRASRNINGTTIHSSISLNSDTEKSSMKMIQTYKGKKVIVVDEISMLNQQLWTQLVNIKRVSGAIFILLGDYRQLPAVEDKDHDYFDSAIARFLTNNNRIELTERQRYDKELWDWLEDFWERAEVGDNLKFSKQIDYEAYNICYYNKTRIEVNKLYMDHYRPDNALFIEHTKKDKDDRACSIYIYEGLPVMAIKNKTKKKNNDDDEQNQTLYCNSDTMKVVSYNDTHITLELDVPDEDDNNIIVIKIEDFHKSFVCNYCSTTHKNQGATITQNIQLWDWEKMTSDRRIAYTAVSRAKRIQQVKVVA
jgi:hypothetical protein